MENIPFHEIANIFPLIQGKEFVELKTDIKANGVHQPVVMYEGQILDGRNRFRASQEVGVTPDFVEYDGNSPLDFVISLNLHRRHLASDQRAAIAVDMLPIFEKEAKERQKRIPVHSVVELIPQQNTGKSRDKAAEALNTNPHYVSALKKIKAEQPEVFEQIKTGEKTLAAVKKEKKHVHVAHNSGENEWYTPGHILDAAREVMGGINFDPASSEIANKTVRADVFCSKDDCGLEKQWMGNVWMNPPYAQPLMANFANKLVSEIENFNQAIVLVNNATETKWFQIMASSAASICFPSSRIKFIDPDGNATGAPLQGQAVLYFGGNKTLFADEFKNFGAVLEVIHA